MSNGTILFQSWGNSQYYNKRLKCNQCQVEFNDGEPRYQHIISGNPCSYVVCLWCCFEKASFYVKIPNKCYLKCCYYRFPQELLNSLLNTLKSTCIICGKLCSSEKKYAGTSQVKFLVGKTCYEQLISRKSIFWNKSSQLDKKISKEIIKYSESQTPCQICKKKLDLLLTTKEEQDLGLCDKCYQKSLQSQKKLYQNIKKCCECKQPEIYKYKNFFTMKKKLFDLAQIPIDWEKSNQKNLYCSFCLYQQYLKMQLQNSQIKWPRYNFVRLKVKYQRHFMDHCLVCSLKVKGSIKVFTIWSLNEQSIFCYICIDCRNFQNNEPNKYKCFKELKQFLIKTAQNNMGTQYSIEKHKFDDLANSLLNKFLKEKEKLKKQNPQSAISIQSSRSPQYRNKASQAEIKNVQFWEKGDLEFQNCRSDQANSQNQNYSMHNNFDNLSNKNYSALKFEKKGYYMKKQQLLYSNPQPNYDDQEDQMEDFNDENNSLINYGNKNTLQSFHQNNAFYDKLEEYQFMPPLKQGNKLRDFDFCQWQKIIIQEFKKIFQASIILESPHQKSFIQPVQDAWSFRKTISDTNKQGKKSPCLMHRICNNQQDYLNLSLLCRLCFVKYLIGENSIVEEVQKIRNSSVKTNEFLSKFKTEQ